MSDKQLNLEQIKGHWNDWAHQFGTNLRATTKTGTAKRIEICALLKAIDSIKNTLPKNARILELGCGNGYNLLSLHEFYPEYLYEGLDFIEEMIISANQNKKDRRISDSAMNFRVGDVLNLENDLSNFDVVFTVRCLINLNNDQLQLNAIKEITQKINLGGYLLMLENSQNSYKNQNRLRNLAGMEERTPAPFNHFLNETAVVKVLSQAGFRELKNENFTALHDLVLYVLVPMINGGHVDYAHPLVEAATKLSLAISKNGNEDFGDYGQNRLYLFQKM